jgi:hypothetical protein
MQMSTRWVGTFSELDDHLETLGPNDTFCMRTIPVVVRKSLPDGTQYDVVEPYGQVEVVSEKQI